MCVLVLMELNCVFVLKKQEYLCLSIEETRILMS